MGQLSPEEKLNLATYSDESTIKVDYDKEGFNQCETRIVEKYMKKKGRVLDLGCGVGRTTKPFYDLGYEVIAVDLSEPMIKYAQKKYKKINFRVMNACDLKFEDGYFDYVFFSFNGIDNIYPIEKRTVCLREMQRVLKKGGRLLFSSHSSLNIPRNRIMLGIWVRNLLSLRLFTKYRREPAANGTLCLYYGIPFLEKRKLEKIGFSVLEVVGAKHSNFLLMHFLEMAPYYIAQK